MKRRAFLAAAAALAALAAPFRVYGGRGLAALTLAQHATVEAYDRFRVVWANTTINVSEDGGVTWIAVPARDFQRRYGFGPDPTWLTERDTKIVFGFRPKEPTT